MAQSPLPVLEFFCGVGGLHCALRRCNVPHTLVCAYDVDDSALRVYRHNAPATSLSGADIVSLSDAELARGGGGLWLLSPPCQPYSRQGLQLGARDGRSAALLHLLDVLERADAAALPAFLLLENVAGFESSETRRRLHAVLAARGFATREVWASPSHFGVPNQRTRYFMLARRVGAFAAAPPEIERLLLDAAAVQAACEGGERVPPPTGEAEDAGACAPLSDFLEPSAAGGDEALAALAVGDHVLERYGAAMDLVGRHSRRSCCFTKNYSRFVKGAGSVLAEGLPAGAAPPAVKDLAALRPLRLRFFAPAEIARLHGFGAGELAFPPEIGRKKQFELLGNSLAVTVVTHLLRFLLAEGPAPPREMAEAAEGAAEEARREG